MSKMDEKEERRLIEYLKTTTAPMTHIKKGWGRTEDGVGEIFAYHFNQEKDLQKLQVDTVKLLYMEEGKRLSRHYHKIKDEFFVCVSGSFFVELWDEAGRPITEFILKKEQRIFIPKGTQHRMKGKSHSNILLEISTADSPEDSYRIEKGD